MRPKRDRDFSEALRRMSELPISLERIYMTRDSYVEALRLAGCSEEEITAQLAALDTQEEP